jgi:hypothetical protein
MLLPAGRRHLAVQHRCNANGFPEHQPLEAPAHSGNSRFKALHTDLGDSAACTSPEALDPDHWYNLQLVSSQLRTQCEPPVVRIWLGVFPVQRLYACVKELTLLKPSSHAILDTCSLRSSRYLTARSRRNC